MYNQNGIYYNENHIIQFATIEDTISNSGTSVNYSTYLETWPELCLIPSSRPVIAHPTVITKTVDKAGKNGYADLTDALTGKPNYGLRTGSWSFYVDIAKENLNTIRDKMLNIIDGKRWKIVLTDDPYYFYEGRFTVGNFVGGAVRPTVSINYQLNPYKKIINYSRLDITVSGGSTTRQIQAQEYPFTPMAFWVSGTVTVSFGGVSSTLSSAGYSVLGKAKPGNNILTVSGTGRVKVEWRGGSL